MGKFAGFLIAGLLGVASLSALSRIYSYSTDPNAPGVGWPSPIDLEIGLGYRQDNFCWSVASPDESPDVWSKVKWKELQMIEVSGFASYTSCRNYVLQISGDYGYICSGRNTDTDASDDDFENVWLKSEHNAGKGYVYDLDAAAGYRFTSTCGRFIGNALVGYSFNDQHLTMFDGKIVQFYDSKQVRETPDVDNTYKVRWFGPFVGFDFAARVEGCAYLFGSVQGHWASYRGSGKWNSTPNLVGFHDKAHGWGYVVSIGGNWEIWDHWSIGAVSTYRHFRTREGSRTNVIGTPVGTFETDDEFKHATWESIDAKAIIVWRF